MRTIVTILLMMFLAQTTKAQEFIFETTAGEIVTKSKFIDQFQNDVYTKLLQKSEMRKDIVIELSYRGFSCTSDYS